MPKEQENKDITDDFIDDDPDPIPAKRDTMIFARHKKEDKDKDDDFEEDVFV